MQLKLLNQTEVELSSEVGSLWALLGAVNVGRDRHIQRFQFACQISVTVASREANAAGVTALIWLSPTIGATLLY